MTKPRLRTATLAFTVAVAATVAGAALSAPVATGARERRSASSTSRILYSSDWVGMRQVYAVDPSGRLPTGQVTFGRPPRSDCATAASRGLCDWWGGSVPSPDGSRVLLWDEVEQGYPRGTLYVARPDGTGRRALGKTNPPATWPPAWSHDSKQVAFTNDSGVWTVSVSGGQPRRAFPEIPSPRLLAWSPDGRSLAFVADNRLLVHRAGRTRTALAPTGNTGIGSLAWSPDGAQIAYATGQEVGVVRPDGTRQRRLLSEGAFDVAWSPQGGQLAVGIMGGPRLDLVNVRTVSTFTVSPGGATPRWSPDGRYLAFTRSTYAESGPTVALTVYDLARRSVRVLDTGSAIDQVTWAPDGSRIAYTRADRVEFLVLDAPGDIRVAAPAGGARTVVAAGGRYGGWVRWVAWTRPPAGTQYRRADDRTVARATADAVTAARPIERLVADGDRVGYVACGHTFTWRPGTASVIQVDPVASLSPWCPPFRSSYAVYSLALAGERVALGYRQGNTGQRWWLGSKGLPGTSPASTLGIGYATLGSPASVVGAAVGSGELAVFSSWLEDRGPTGIFVRRQEIHRVAADGSDAGVIAAEPGPFVPLDVDTGRIVAAGDNAVVLLAGDGTRLLTVPVRAAGAALSGDDLALLVPGSILHVDARTGAELHRWPVPGLAVGWRCADPRYTCKPGQLVLDDVARGLAVYVAGTDIHLLRLADGIDRVVATGTLARFTDTGLVYANGARLTLVPFAQLPA